jgi:AcrR family transcriptional regulator
MTGRQGQEDRSRPSSGRRHPALVRRRLIIDAARTVIARRGMAATRMREVASAAGVSLGTLTYHFTGIDELLAGVIRAEGNQFLQPIIDRALAADTGREGLRCLVEELFNDDERTREYWLLWLDFWTLASHDPRYGRWQVEAFGEWRTVIAELVARGRADGSLSVTDPALAVTEFMVLTDGVAAQAYLTGRDPTVVTTPPSALLWALVADVFRFRDGALESAAAGRSHQRAL